MRTSKTNAAGEITYFTYDNNRNLVLVQSGTHRLEYSYNAIDQLSAITIDGITYLCELLDKSLYRLLDSEGNVVVEYHYENGFVVSVYGKNEQGELVDKTNDKEFVGNLNQVTYKSYYFDEETGWYYCGRYYDAVDGRFVDGINSSSAEMFLLQRRNNEDEEVSVREAATVLYNSYINNSEFGAPKDVPSSGNWYDGMLTPEILARLIYGENPYQSAPSDERVALAWVLWNRKMHPDFDFMLSSIATSPEQFHAICHGSEDARIPDTDSTQWKISVLYACYLYCTETVSINQTSELEALLPRPYGITSDHVYFCSYDSAMNKLQNGTILRNGVIAGYGSIGSTPVSLEANYWDYDETYYEEYGTHIVRYVNNVRYECINIFYCD